MVSYAYGITPLQAILAILKKAGKLHGMLKTRA